jgi:hypothetical protein
VLWSDRILSGYQILILSLPVVHRGGASGQILRPILGRRIDGKNGSILSLLLVAKNIFLQYLIGMSRMLCGLTL